MGEFLKPSHGAPQKLVSASACLCVPPRPSRPERVNALMLFSEWAEIPFGSQTEEATRTGIEKSRSQTCARICLSADLVSSSSSPLSSFRTKNPDGFRVADSHGRSSGYVEGVCTDNVGGFELKVQINRRCGILKESNRRALLLGTCSQEPGLSAPVELASSNSHCSVVLCTHQKGLSNERSWL